MPWDIEAMPIYQDMLRFVGMAEREAARIERRRRNVADHLRRSSTSALLNLREALEEFAPREKSRLLRLMQRETGECCAAFDAIVQLHAGTPETTAAKALARNLIAQAAALGHAALQRLDPPNPCA